MHSQKYLIKCENYLFHHQQFSVDLFAGFILKQKRIGNLYVISQTRDCAFTKK